MHAAGEEEKPGGRRRDFGDHERIDEGATAPHVGGREASRAEALDATVCKPFYHALYLGEVYRLAEMVGEPALADALGARLVELTARLERESSLVVLPLRPLVAVQAGAGLLALAAGD